MATTRQSMSALMAPFFKKITLDRYKQLDKQYTQIYNVDPSTKAYESSMGIAGFGIVPEKPESGGIMYDDPIQGFSTRFIHLTYGMGFQVTAEAMADDQYKMLGKKMSEQLGKSAAVTKEIIAAAIINNGFTATNGPDGLSLFNTAHALTGGGTYPNRPSVATALSITSLQAALLQVRRTVDDRNKQLMIKPAYLIVPPELEYSAYELLNSTLVPGGSTNNINSVKGAVKEIIVMDYLTSTTAWFLATEKPDHSLQWYNRDEMEFDDTTDFDTGNAKFKMWWRSSCGFGDWRGLWGNPGA